MKNARKSFLLTSALLAVLLFAAPARAQDDSGSGYSNAAIMNYEQRLSAVEDQIRTLTGKTEQVDYALRRISATLDKMQTDDEMRLSKLEQTQSQMLAAQQMVATSAAQAQQAMQQQAAQQQAAQQQAAQAAAATPDEVAEINGTLGAIKMQDGKVTGGVKSPKAPPLPKTPADYGLSPQEQYDRAFGLLRQASYDDAEKAFKGFIDKNPQDKLLDNAKYWYAETFYVRGKYSEAAVAFADAFQQNPKGTKAPDSLLKLGMALGQLDKPQDACVTLGELKTKYPNAPATVRARADQERARLKCGK
jgi:tol-pal system protein YbgF